MSNPVYTDPKRDWHCPETGLRSMTLPYPKLILVNPEYAGDGGFGRSLGDVLEEAQRRMSEDRARERVMGFIQWLRDKRIQRVDVGFGDDGLAHLIFSDPNCVLYEEFCLVE